MVLLQRNRDKAKGPKGKDKCNGPESPNQFVAFHVHQLAFEGDQVAGKVNLKLVSDVVDPVASAERDSAAISKRQLSLNIEGRKASANLNM